MKRFTLTTALLCLLVSSVYGQELIQINPGAILRIDERIRSFHPRIEGSRGESDTVAFIVDFLEETGAAYSVHDFSGMERGHSFSSTIEISIPGQIRDELVIAVPLNHSDDASSENDGSIGLALVLGLVESLSFTVPPVSLRFLLLGAEFGDSEAHPIGSREFLSGYRPDYQAVALFVNFENIPSRVLVRSGGRGIVSPYWFTERISRALSNTDLFYLIMGNENQFYRIGIADESSAIEPFLEEGFPSISLESSAEPLAGGLREDWIYAFVRFIDNVMQSSSGGFPSEWDRHFLIFQAKRFSLIISEHLFLGILIGVMTLALLYPIFARRKFKEYVSIVMRNSWSLPVLLLAIFTFFLLATLFIEGIANLRGIPHLWRYTPALSFSMMTTAAITLFSVSFTLFRKLPFSKRGRFYSASALLFLLLDMIGLAVMDISLSYYVVWAFIWAFLFTLFRDRYLRVFCLLMSPLWLLKSAYDIFTLPSESILRILIASRVNGNLLLSALLLPFILLSVRVYFLFRHPSRTVQRRNKIISQALLAAVVVGLSGALLFSKPFGPGRPLPVSMVQSIDLDESTSLLTLESPGPLGTIGVTGFGFSEIIESGGTSFSLSSDTVPDLLDIETSTNRFLDRKEISLIIAPRGRPVSIEILLTASEPIVIYDASFPFQVLPGGTRANVYIGRNPPVPLPVTITVPDDLELAAELRLRYTDPPFPFDAEGEDIAVGRTVFVKATVGL